MAKGILFAMVCPMLEDELIYMLSEDGDPKDVYVLDTPYNGSLKRKMAEKGVEYTEIPEESFMNGTRAFDPDRYSVVIRMKNLGLHAEPKELKSNIEKDLVGLNGKVDAVALYYGMCGNFGWDPSVWADEALDYPLRIFKDEQGRVIDDCVGVAVGGVDGYHELLRRYKNSMLFTPEIATNWLDFLSASDLMAMFQGEEDIEKTKSNLKMIMEMCGYRAVVQIDTGYEDRTDFDRCTKEFADYNGFEITQCDEELVDRGPAQRLYAESKALLG